MVFSQGEEKVAFEEALERFKRGRCPCCGKGIGEPRGLEFRSRLSDLYCHTCRRNWSVELNIEDLREEFALSEVIPPNVSTDSIPEDGPKPTGVGRFRTFIQRIVLKH